MQAVVVVAALAACGRASAALGEPADSVAEDQQALKATRRAAKPGASYTVERLETKAHTVREYVTPSGTVFAVAWEGVSRPDLTVVLGAYAEPYLRAVEKAGRSGRRSRRVETGGAVVETWGHQRALHGRAYVPSLLPPGVTADDVK